MKTNPQTKRANWHDYPSPCRYLITLSKAADTPPFSQIAGDWRLPVGTRGSSYTLWAPTGRIIADMLYHIGNIHPALQTEQYTVMPDHVHFLIRQGLRFMRPRTPADYRSLGSYATRQKHMPQNEFTRRFHRRELILSPAPFTQLLQLFCLAQELQLSSVKFRGRLFLSLVGK